MKRTIKRRLKQGPAKASKTKRPDYSRRTNAQIEADKIAEYMRTVEPEGGLQDVPVTPFSEKVKPQINNVNPVPRGVSIAKVPKGMIAPDREYSELTEGGAFYELTDKQVRFAEELMSNGGNMPLAYRDGFDRHDIEGDGDARARAKRVLALPEVRRYITDRTRKLSKDTLTDDRVLLELQRVALVDIRGMVDSEGAPLPIHKLSADMAAAISSFKIHENKRDGTRTYDYKLWPKGDNLKTLAQILGLLVTRHEVNITGDLSIKTEMDALTHISELEERVALLDQERAALPRDTVELIEEIEDVGED